MSSLYWLYCAQQPALILLLFKWLRTQSGVHEFILFPVLVASFNSAFPMLFAMRLGESQINFYSALQATEFVGVHGLDAIIALSNIVSFRLLYTFIKKSKEHTRKLTMPVSISASILVAWIAYGHVSFTAWEDKQKNWQSTQIGIVQPNEKPRLSKTISYPGFSKAYPPEMAMTERLSKQGAELVIWPEAQAKAYLNNPLISAAYQRNVAKLNTSLMFQDTEQIKNQKNGKNIQQFNSAILLNQNGAQTGQYQKLKRVPFGEYIPLISESNYLRNKTKVFLGDFLNEISKGEGHQTFNHKSINIIPLICYETTFPSFVANAVKNSIINSKHSRGHVLIALSNDGWFGSTHLPYQHVMGSVLRAVENRTPLVHVANNGPSIAVSPSGRITFTSEFQRSGGYITDVSHSKSTEGSFYSQYPMAFIYTVYAILLASILVAIARVLNKHRIRPSHYSKPTTAKP